MPLPKYLVDSNVFIQAKNMYYRFDFCGGFWDWLKHAHNQKILYSIKKVKSELCAPITNDSAKTWALEMPNTFFLEDINDAAVMQEYAKIMSWMAASNFKPAAKVEFARADVADAFLIAVAKAHNYTIVTQEQSNPDAKRKIYLPDAALANGVNTLYIYDMLSSHSSSTFAPKS